MTSFSTSAHEILNINAPAREIEDYLERFELWCLTKGTLSSEIITAHFLNGIGKDAYALLKNLSYPTAPSKKPYTELKSILLSHVTPKNFEIAERAKFNILQRQPSQSIREFILQLQTQATRCAFKDKLDEHLRDRLIAGINIPDLYRQLLLVTDPTFETIKLLCEQYQDVNDLSKSQSGSSESSVFFGSANKKVHSMHSKQRQYNKGKQTFISNQSTSNNSVRLGKCASCGKLHSRQTCPFRSVKCHKCGKIGHIQSVCRRTNTFTTQVNQSTNDISDTCDEFNILSLAVPSVSGHLYQILKFANDQSYRFIVDTGSVESIISKNSLDALYPDISITETPISIRGITGHALPILGCCELKVRDVDHRLVPCKFIVTNSGPSILGLKVLQSLKIQISLLSQLSRTDFNSQIKELLHACSLAEGGMKIPPIHLEVTGDPVFMKRRPIPFGLRDSVKKVLDLLCERNIVVPVEHSLWATPIVTPLKQDGQTPRVCGDYRVTLNSRLLQRSCTTEEPEAILSRFHGSCIFSKIDLKDAFLQIPLDEASSQLTTINTPFGLYRYQFLPFGLTVSPAIFQDTMNSLLSGLPGIEIYQDDVMIHAPDKDTHDERILALLRRFKQSNVRINSKKCVIGVREFTCLGYRVTSDGVRPDMDRLKPLVDVDSPENIRELRSLMGVLQYYSKYIPNFASIADPLFNLMNSENYVWSNKHETVLRQLLSHLTTDAVLRPFTPNVRPVLITDASPTGIGAVLEQNGHPVLCVSRRLSEAEKGYAQTLREALAVYWAVTRLHKYLFGIPFTIATDHEALKFIYNPKSSLAKSSAAMVQRWSIVLSAYTYTIEHRSAKLIPHVDFLSRHASTCDTFHGSDCLLTQPLPIPRSLLIADTKKYFGSIISAVKRGWSSWCKRKYPKYYSRRSELCVSPEGLLCLNDRIVIPPTLRSVILKDLHSGHLGIEKMKSLARNLCWWEEIDADIRRTAASCEGCTHKIFRQPSKWSPWPLTCEPWQRIHVDYCGPFLNNYHALVIIDSFSKWPEVMFTNKPCAEFTIKALRKVFSREGFPVAVVSDNGSHFSAACVTNWLNQLGCRHLFTAPRHPQSNGLAENFVGTLKRAIASASPTSFQELDCCVDNFLLQYRNCIHCTSGDTPAKLSKSRSLRSNMLGLDSAEVSFYRGNDFRPSSGIVIGKLGNTMIKIMDLNDLTIHRRHVDQIQYNESGQSRSDSNSVDNPNDPIVDTNVSEPTIPEVRRSERLQSKPVRNYKHPESISSCGGCTDCHQNDP